MGIQYYTGTALRKVPRRLDRESKLDCVSMRNDAVTAGALTALGVASDPSTVELQHVHPIRLT